ncbi:MAG: hypothetical exported protein [Marine Group I thaumarchaeote]|nr:MAG: hypothetical exported protein [Marine Group I thaumarchaeote]
MNKISTLVMFFAVLSIPMSLGLQEAFAGVATSATPTGTITILATCGATASGNIIYTSLGVGSTTNNANEQVVTITNTGNRNVDVIVSATDWTDTVTAFPVVMLAGVTHFSTTADTAYGTQTTMPKTGTATENVVLGLTPQSTQDVFHKVSIVLVPAQSTFQATAEQTETFAFDCPGP